LISPKENMQFHILGDRDGKRLKEFGKVKNSHGR
jgi:hypothetical protein